MKQYLHYFRWLFAAAVILVVLYLWLLWENHILLGGGERRNEECRTQERVFDYGDVLTEEEEEELRGLIAETEKRTCCDIVLVTLNESLKEYAREQEPDVPYREFVRVYAEEFYDSNAFGYNQPIGDGVVLVDNWYREDDGRVYTWLCAVGRAEEEYTESRIDSLLDAVYWYIEDDPYRAYKEYINKFGDDMAVHDGDGLGLPGYFPVLAAFIAMTIFIILHWSYKKGKKTVVTRTYVKGTPELYQREDTFLHKNVSRRHIQRNTGSGRSGSHGGYHGGGSSGGGGSHGGHHGGGGRSR